MSDTNLFKVVKPTRKTKKQLSSNKHLKSFVNQGLLKNESVTI